LPDYLNLRSHDDGRVISRRTHPTNFDQGARPEWKNGPWRDQDTYAGGGITRKESANLRPGIGIVISNHGTQMNRVAAPGFAGLQAMCREGSGQCRQCCLRRYGRYRPRQHHQPDGHSSQEDSLHCAPRSGIAIPARPYQTMFALVLSACVNLASPPNGHRFQGSVLVGLYRVETVLSKTNVEWVAFEQRWVAFEQRWVAQVSLLRPGFLRATSHAGTPRSQSLDVAAFSASDDPVCGCYSIRKACMGLLTCKLR
jgi:hypothetical protein